MARFAWQRCLQFVLARQSLFRGHRTAGNSRVIVSIVVEMNPALISPCDVATGVGEARHSRAALRLQGREPVIGLKLRVSHVLFCSRDL